LTIKAVFFDLGGTLLVMRRDRVFRQVLYDLGIDVELDAVHSSYGRVESWWVGEYGGRKLTPDQTVEAYRDLDAKVFINLFPRATEKEAEDVSKTVRDRWPAVEKTIPLQLYPDAEPALETLKSRGYRMALVSNAPPDTQRAVESLGLPRYLDPIVISGLVGYSKPHPEIFKIAMRGAGVEPSETIHVGDLYESDVVGAKSAGIEGILLDREGRTSRDDCRTISTLDGLAQVLGF